MKQTLRYILTNALMALAVVSANAQDACLEVDFTQGIPEDFTLVCNDDMPVNSANFKNLFPAMTWFVEAADCSDGKAAFSTSHRTYDLPTDNWLITPEIQLPSEGGWVKWTARAIHYHLRDGYKVMVTTGNVNDLDAYVELVSIEAEEYLWTEHVASLQEYAGQTVHIAFVHDSQNKFLLAIDDIFVGQPSEVDFIVEDKTPRFVGNVGTTQVVGTVLNSGVELSHGGLACVVNGTDTLLSAVCDDAWKTGVSRDFSFEIPVYVGQVTDYKVMAGEHIILEDSVICSYYPRTLLLEKATGMWCVNCPEVISYIQELEERYGHGIVCVEAHAHNSDPLEYMSYVSTGMKVNNFPAILFNRDRSNPLYKAEKSNKTLKLVINDPTVAMVEVEADSPVGDSIKVTSKVTFANETDNSSDKYRIGYVLIEKQVQTELMRQINGCESLTHGEYYYMRNPIASELMFFSNVVRSDYKAFVGIKNSLPASIKSEEENVNSVVLNIPATVADCANLAVVAIAMNYYTDEVLNVAEVKVPVNPQTVLPILSEQRNSLLMVTVYADGTCRIACPAQAPFEVGAYSIDGRSVATWSGSGSATFNLSAQLGKGVYLLRISQAGRVWTRKIVL